MSTISMKEAKRWPGSEWLKDHPRWMEALYDSAHYGPGHLNFIRLGREICHSRDPQCTACPLNKSCDFYKENR